LWGRPFDHDVVLERLPGSPTPPVEKDGLKQRIGTFFCFGGDGRPAEFFDGSFAPGYSELFAQRLVRHQQINFLGQIGREFVRIYRLERGRLHLLQGYEKPGFTSTTTSLIPPTAAATTAVSQAIASRLMIPKGS